MSENLNKIKNQKKHQKKVPKQIGVLADAIGKKYWLWADSVDHPKDKRRQAQDLINLTMQLLALEGFLKSEWVDMNKEIQSKTELFSIYPDILEEILNLQSALIAELQMELYRLEYWSKEEKLERSKINIGVEEEGFHQIIKGGVEE